MPRGRRGNSEAAVSEDNFANFEPEPDTRPVETQSTGFEEGEALPGVKAVEFQPSTSGDVLIVSEKRKGKTIVAVTGKLITFDSEGKAKVNRADAEYLKNCPGFTID